MENEKSPLTVGINQKMSVGELLLFAVQHLMGITFLLAVPGIIGAACGLTSADIGYMVQSCFITAGLVTILQSIFILKLPAVHGPRRYLCKQYLQQVLHMDLEQLMAQC